MDREIRTYASVENHEEMDGLSTLRFFGFNIRTFHPFAFPWNPLARKGTLMAGLDPLRTIKILFNYRSFDAIISIAISSCFFFMLLKKIFNLRKPVVVIDPALGDGYPTRKKIQDQVLPFANHIIVYGKAQLHYLEQEYGKKAKTTFLYHRMDTTFFDPLNAVMEFPKGIGAGPYLYSVGNDPMRDFNTLVEAAKDLKIRTIIQTKKNISESSFSRVEKFSDWISFPELRNRYCHASIVIVPLFPTIYAGGINGLLEAMSMGRPVIVSRSEGILDYVRDEIDCLIVPAQDPLALKNAIERLLSNPELAEKLGKNARKFCEENCAMPIYAENVAKILQVEIENSVR